MEFIIAALCGVIIILLVIILIRMGGDKEGMADIRARLDMINKQISDEFERGRRDSGAYQKDMREETAKSLAGMEEKLAAMTRENAAHQRQLSESLSASLNTIRRNNEEQNERQSQRITEAITKMQDSNEKRLDQMRQTVDEKLSATLSTRLDSSFKTVSEQLENVYKSLGEMKSLSEGVTTNVTTLNRVLTNVKARGTWAEVQLEGILDQTIPGMYERNYAARPNSRERVEFAVRIPAGGESEQVTHLPIDSKFPMEDYVRLCDAADSADAEEVQRARKALEERIIVEARMICKYINVPETTPFAIMYLATEGLYAEIASSRTGLPERIQNEYNIMIAGPNTITALLNSLSMGFRAVAINEKANEVRKLLTVAKTQYDKFTELLKKARNKIEEAGNTLDMAQKRNELIHKKLKGIDTIDLPEAEAYLSLPADETADED